MHAALLSSRILLGSKQRSRLIPLLNTMVQHHPSALRNRPHILKELKCFLSSDELASGYALEVASGTGAHLEVLAPAFPNMTFQPSEYIADDATADVGKIGSREGAEELVAINSVGKQFPNILPAIGLDASLPFSSWSISDRKGTATLVYCSNVFHITDWKVGKGILAGAGQLLKRGGRFVVYGPFKIDGEFTTESNAAFHESLQARNPNWGYRDVDADVAAEAERHGLKLREKKSMPANNLMLVFEKV